MVDTGLKVHIETAKSFEITIRTQDGRCYYHDYYYGYPYEILSLIEFNLTNVAYTYERGFLVIIVDSKDFQGVVDLYRTYNNEYF